MNHEESKIQQQCVSWFRAQYPQFSMLLVHPINEGSQYTRVTGAIHKAEGAVAGVSDLLFFMAAEFDEDIPGFIKLYRHYQGLCIEFKTPKGKQSPEQKEWERMVKAAGYEYKIVRSVDEFRTLIKTWIEHANLEIKILIAQEYHEIKKEREAKELAHFKKVIGKK